MPGNIERRRRASDRGRLVERIQQSVFPEPADTGIFFSDT